MTGLLVGTAAMAATWLFSCGPKLEGIVRLDSGEVACGHKRTIWESQSTAAEPVACRLYVRFSGAAGCRPVFYKPASGGGLIGVTAAPVPGTDYHEIRDRVSRLELECEGSGDGVCSYQVVRVVCHDPENKVTIATSGETAEGRRPKCGDPEATVWTKPAGKQCHASVKLSAPPNCPARLTSAHSGGRTLTLDVAGGSSRLWTLVDVNRIDLRCGEAAGEAACTFSVLTTECR
jgi:hypothetical protein